MFKEISKKMLLFSLIFGLVTAGGVYYYLYSLNQGPKVEMAAVVIVKKDVPNRTVLSDEYLELKKLPKDIVHPNALSSLEEARGKIAKTSLLAGEQLLAERLGSTENTAGGLAYQLKTGFRAMTVSVNEITGVAGLARPGNYVDIMVTVDKEDYGRDFTKTILQNRLVLAVDGQTSPGALEQGKGVKNYTLEVTPQEAELLGFAEDKGKIRLILRSQGDQGWVEAQGSGFGNI